MRPAPIVLIVLLTTLVPSTAFAQRHHRAPAYDQGAATSTEIIRRRTEEAQHEPGLAKELFPDFNQTATGGPSGGFPTGR